MAVFTYPITNVRVVDGDTIECDIHLGLNVTLSKQMVRMYGIDAPERRGESRKKGNESRFALKYRLDGSKGLVVRIDEQERDSFGRCLGTLMDSKGDINQWMLTEGFAKPYEES